MLKLIRNALQEYKGFADGTEKIIGGILFQGSSPSDEDGIKGGNKLSSLIGSVGNRQKLKKALIFHLAGCKVSFVSGF